jgi:hypothetical protein
MAGFKTNGNVTLFNPEGASRPSLDKSAQSSARRTGPRGYSGGADVAPLGGSSSSLQGVPVAAEQKREIPIQKKVAQVSPPPSRTNKKASVQQPPPKPAVEEKIIESEDVVPMAHPAAVGPTKDAFNRIYKLAVALGAKPNDSGRQSTFNFADNDLSPVVIDVIMSGIFGSEWWGWLPETFDGAVKKLNTYGVTLSQNNRDKAHAMATIHVTNSPWVDHYVFEKVVMALNGASPEFGHYEDVSPGMILRAVEIMRQANDNEFKPEVIQYIAAKFVEHGQLIMPDNELGGVVQSNIFYLVDDEFSEEEYSGITSVWKQFEENVGMDADPKIIDGLSDEDINDMSVVRAYLTKRYAMDEKIQEQEQLNSLASWAVAIGGSK